MDKENGIHSLDKFTKAHINLTKKVEAANIHGETAVSMKDNFKTTKSTRFIICRNGNGILSYPDGRELRGIWQEGKLIEEF